MIKRVLSVKTGITVLVMHCVGARANYTDLSFCLSLIIVSIF